MDRTKLIDALAFMLNDVEDYLDAETKVRASLSLASAEESFKFEGEVNHAIKSFQKVQAETGSRMAEIDVELAEIALSHEMLAADLSKLNYERGMVGVEVAKKKALDEHELELKKVMAQVEIDARLLMKEKIHELERRLGQDSVRQEDGRPLAETANAGTDDKPSPE